MRSQKRIPGHIRGAVVAAGFGLLAGYLVGVGMMGSYKHAMWPVLAGLVAGMAGSLAAPRRRVPVAFGGGCIAMLAAVATIVHIQFRSGRWPIADEFTLTHYGSAMQAAARTAVILGVLIGIPCLMTAALVALARHRAAQRTAGME